MLGVLVDVSGRGVGDAEATIMVVGVLDVGKMGVVVDVVAGGAAAMAGAGSTAEAGGAEVAATCGAADVAATTAGGVVVTAGAVVVAGGRKRDEGTKAVARIEFKKAESVLGMAVHLFPLMERRVAPAGRLAEVDIMKRRVAIPVAGKV